MSAVLSGMLMVVLWIGWLFIFSVVSTIVVHVIGLRNGEDSLLVKDLVVAVVAGPMELFALIAKWLGPRLSRLFR